MRIETDLFVYFVAVADQLSFRKAAEQLGIAQPWLSRQVRKLEELLGFDLFVRTTRRVELTEKGRRLLTRARIMAREVEATRSMARTLKRENPQKLRFGVPLYALYVPERVRLFDEFHAAHPHVQLEMCMGDTHKLREDLAEGDLDGLFWTGPLEETTARVLTLSERRLQVVFPPNDPLLAQDEIRMADIADRNVAVFRRDSNPGLYDELFCIFDGIDRRRIEYPSITFAHHLSEENAVTVVPGWAAPTRGDGVRRTIADCCKTSRLLFMVRWEIHTESLQQFWDMASDLASRTTEAAALPSA